MAGGEGGADAAPEPRVSAGGAPPLTVMPPHRRPLGWEKGRHARTGSGGEGMSSRTGRGSAEDVLTVAPLPPLPFDRAADDRGAAEPAPRSRGPRRRSDNAWTRIEPGAQTTAPPLTSVNGLLRRAGKGQPECLRPVRVELPDARAREVGLHGAGV